MIVKSKLWDIRKNIEEDEKSAQKKEELEKEIRKNNHFTSYVGNNSN